MRNEYTSKKMARVAFMIDPAWEFARNYFNRAGEVSICFDGEKYFIITHADCVNYRIKQGQHIQYITTHLQ